MRKSLLNTVASAGGLAAVGAALFGAVPARADWPTFDAITHFLIQQSQKAITTAEDNVRNEVTNIGKKIGDSVTNLQTDLNDVLSKGFSQQANYAKAQVSANEQIVDASNAAMARVGRDTRNAQIASEHVPDPQQCTAIDHGQVAVSAATQAVVVASEIGQITDARGEANFGQPSYYGQAQGVQAINNLHYSRYCSDIEQDAGLCTVTPSHENGDQRAWNLFGRDNLGDQDGVNTANDLATNLIQPIVPAAMRAEALTSVSAQDAAAKRRSYNARMSLARNTMSYVIGVEAPSVTLTDVQKAQLAKENLPPTDTGSYLQALTLEVDRRFSDLGWAASLQAMPPATVQREIATELSVTNYLMLQIYRMQIRGNALAATQVAQNEESRSNTVGAMPSPLMTAK